MNLHGNSVLITFCLVVGCMVSILAGCGAQSRNLRLLKQSNVKSKEVADLLAGVKDVSSAKAAEPRLNRALAEFNKVSAALETSYDSSDVDPGDRPAAEEHAAEGILQMQRMLAETMRIAKQPQVVAALGETWNQLPSTKLMEATGLDQELP
jgi:hypothetical protein